ncbi:hypothetical protein [Novosphingobium taihuense]|uniref:Uncharacterized protein n=1 Tax=Novosphingobium taihuense TaxID=260085 RepID=A0A7W7EUN6_9SPHN|nr:hypothetical protein [Novosphingobium taihuense]MBB4614179.1 hypothetical protein [Novosphingobium taihuense]
METSIALSSALCQALSMMSHGLVSFWNGTEVDDTLVGFYVGPRHELEQSLADQETKRDR